MNTFVQQEHIQMISDRKHTLLKKIKGTRFNHSIASSQLNSWDIDLVS